MFKKQKPQREIRFRVQHLRVVGTDMTRLARKQRLIHAISILAWFFCLIFERLLVVFSSLVRHLMYRLSSVWFFFLSLSLSLSLENKYTLIEPSTSKQIELLAPANSDLKKNSSNWDQTGNLICLGVIFCQSWCFLSRCWDSFFLDDILKTLNKGNVKNSSLDPWMYPYKWTIER